MAPGGASSKNNVLPLWGNEKTMNLNNLILTNIQSSHYFKVNLFELKTYHEVIDEIYYKVAHLEPWEKGSRKTSGQTGMCGGVRGVGAGGIVSTAFCLLYKLFTLKLTRKQVNGLLTHCDSPYIRALGFMYIRYTQPPADLWDWYEGYLDDEEELDVKAGGGCVMTIGEMLRHYLTKLEWYSTLFPRIPVPIQKDLERKLMDHGPMMKVVSRNNGIEGPGGSFGGGGGGGGNGGGGGAANYNHSDSPGRGGSTNDFKDRHITDEEVSWGEAERIAKLRRSPSRERRSKEEGGERRKHGGGEWRSNGERSDERDRSGRRDVESSGGGERRHDHRERPREHHHHHHKDSREKSYRDRSRSRDRRHSREQSRHYHRERSHHRRSRSRSNERYREK